MYARIGGDGGTDVDADGRGVNELDMRDAPGVYRADVRGQSAAVYACLKRGNEAFQHHRGLAGAGHACDNGEPPFGNVHLQRLDGVNFRSGQVNDAV